MVAPARDLEGSFALLETLFKNAPIGLTLIDRGFRVVRINDALASLRGLAAEALVGKTVNEILPDLWPSFRPFLERAFAGESQLNLELDFPETPGGPPTRHLLMSYYPVSLQGDVIGCGVVVEDITERKEAERALAVRNNLYSMLSRTNHAVAHCQSAEDLYAEICAIAVETGRFQFAWVGVPDGSVVRMVACAGDHGGLVNRIVVSLDEADPRSHGPTGRAFLVGRPFVQNDLLSVPMPPAWRELTMLSGIRCAAAFPFREKDRVTAALTLYASEPNFFTPELQTTLSELTPSVSFALDSYLREQKRAQDEAELRLRDRAIGVVSQGIVITDASLPDRPIIYVSPGFERLTGYSAAEVLGKSCAFLHGKDTDPAAIARISQAFAEGAGCSVELLDYRKDGSTFLNDLSLSPVSDPDGRLTHFVAVQTDVTEKKRLEEQFRQAQKMEAVGRLAAGVAHDFNNLLTIINGYSDPALTSPLPDDPLREVLSEIHKAGERAETLTRQLLAFSRQQVLEPRILSLNSVVIETEKMLRRMIGEDVELVTALSPHPWLVRADAGQLSQILLNLAINARDAMPTGGELTIETENVTLDERACRALQGLSPGDYVKMSVKDTGHGMDDATKMRLFEPFFTTKGLGKGTGLGLATVHGIVQQSRGSVDVQSQLGAGATFTIYLPRAPIVDVDKAPPARLQSMPPGTETVLVVEDQEAVRTLAAHILRSCGYTVLEAADGKDALALAESYTDPIHLLVSDVVMPHLGGRALAQELLAKRPTCKVLFLSGYTDDALIHHGVLEAEYAFLQKPFTPSLLARKVRMVLAAKG